MCRYYHLNLVQLTLNALKMWVSLRIIFSFREYKCSLNIFGCFFHLYNCQRVIQNSSKRRNLKNRPRAFRSLTTLVHVARVIRGSTFQAEVPWVILPPCKNGSPCFNDISTRFWKYSNVIYNNHKLLTKPFSLG